MDMDPDHVSHQTLLVKLVEVSTKVDRLLDDQREARDAMGGEAGVYSRLNRLEQTRAQVLVLAVVCSLVVPVMVTVAMDRLWPAATVEVTTPDPAP